MLAKLKELNRSKTVLKFFEKNHQGYKPMNRSSVVGGGG